MELDWFEATLITNYELTVGGRLSLGAADDKEATVFKRVIRLTDIGVEYEAFARTCRAHVFQCGIITQLVVCFLSASPSHYWTLRCL